MLKILVCKWLSIWVNYKFVFCLVEKVIYGQTKRDFAEESTLCGLDEKTSKILVSFYNFTRKFLKQRKPLTSSHQMLLTKKLNCFENVRPCLYNLVEVLVKLMAYFDK